jgi:ubiquinone/menaquinone biosynthesis C-methylase UbiE
MFRRGDMYALPFGDAAFDTVTMDRVLANADRPAKAIEEAARTLRAGGRLCLIEDFDILAERDGNPLAVLRGWLASTGLKCERIHPVDIEVEGGTAHVLLLIGRSNSVLGQAA